MSDLSLSGSLRKFTLMAVLLLSASMVFAQGANDETNWKPTGKGYGVQDNTPNGQATHAKPSSNGINYHGGPVMLGNVPVYIIWYGNWNQGSANGGNNTSSTQSLLTSLINGLSGSGYEQINTTYYDGNNNHTSGTMGVAGSTSDAYSQGTTLTDASVQAVVSRAISNGMAKDSSALYFVLTSSDVNESSGFCTQYCGWHTHGTIGGSDIKYSFVGNPDRCPSACEETTTAPVGNNTGANGMASIIAHESEEAISDPDLNAWYDVRGAENADKCAWKFGPLSTDTNGAAYNQTLGGNKWLIQMNWANAGGGGCAVTYPSNGVSWQFFTS